ncbi:MAG: hypothetical protein ABIR37_00245 [Candidatus Saccharimonadales bacterium]
MITPQELTQKLITNAAGTPYIVTPTDGGFQMSINIVDAKWYTLLYKNGIKKTFTIDARLNEAKHAAVTTDTMFELNWQAGADVNTFTPSLGAKINMHKGEIWSYKAGKQYGVTESGRVGETASWKFSSVEAKEWLDNQLKESGWHRAMGGTAKGALIFAIVILVIMAIAFPVAYLLK